MIPWISTNGFGVIGHSLGGHNGLFTAAFDPRIKVIISSCGFDSFVDYMGGEISGWTSDRYMPKLLDYPRGEYPFDFAEVLAALAPRTCWISAPKGDTNFRWASADACVQSARSVYQLYGAGQQLRIEHPDINHSFPKAMREKAYQILDEVLKPK